MVGLGALNLNLFAPTGVSGRAPIQEIDLSGALTPGLAEPVERPPDPRRLPPWDRNVTPTPTERLAREALNDRFLIDRSLGNGPGSAARDANDRELFILHNAVNKLRALAERASATGTSAVDRARLAERIDRGLKEVSAYASTAQLDGAVLLSGKRLLNHATETLNRPRAEYDTRVLATGSNLSPEAFQGDRRFSISITEMGVTQALAIDLSEMGAAPRTFEAVTGFINQKLADAGVDTRITTARSERAAARKDDPPIVEFRLRVAVGAGERVRFDAAPVDTAPSVTVAGARQIGTAQQSAVLRLDERPDAAPTIGFDRSMEAARGTATIRAMARDEDGNTFVVADSTGEVGNLEPKASRDVVLQKIDSTGSVVWTRALGSAAPAEGFSIAVAPDGRIAVAGAVNGLADRERTTTGNQRDGFVAGFDVEGRDAWFHQRGAQGADQADFVAFAPDGTLYVQGRTVTGLEGQPGSGDSDVTLQAFDPQGALSWTRVVATVGADTPAGLVVDNGVPVLAWNSATGAQVRALDPADGSDFPTGLDAASLGLGRITALALADDGTLVLSGTDSAGTANQLRRLDPDTGTILMSSDTGPQAIRAIAVQGERLAVALGPVTGSDGRVDTTRSAIEIRDMTTGAVTTSTSAAIAANGPIALALSEATSRSLSAMGLPEGELRFGDTERITDRTSLRAGDHFFIRVNGTRETRITIAAGETFRTLAEKVNRALVQTGRAEARNSRGAESLVITPTGNARIELRAGAGSQDALKPLGLDPGVAMRRGPSAGGTRSVSDPPPTIALDIPPATPITTAAQGKSVMDALDGVLRRIRLGYREISNDPTQVELRKMTSQGRPSATAAASIAQYNRQTAAAQDALRRLGVG